VLAAAPTINPMLTSYDARPESGSAGTSKRSLNNSPPIPNDVLMAATRGGGYLMEIIERPVANPTRKTGARRVPRQLTGS
jgi:hypothetical protein